jgi:multiple sugar transport system substrate-binding protein
VPNDAGEPVHGLCERGGDLAALHRRIPEPRPQQYFETTFAKFQEETGISVTYESVPWDDAANKLTVLGTSGQLPDVMTTWAGWLGQFTAAGWVKPLNDYIAGTEGEYADTVTKLVWKGEKELYGNTYTVPDGVMVKGVYVRKDWAAEAGLSLDPAKGWTTASSSTRSTS